MQRVLILGATTLCLALGVTACGGAAKKSEADIKRDISTTLQSGGNGIDKKAADCFAEIVVDEVGVDKLRDVDLSADEPPAELVDEISSATMRAAEECDFNMEEIGGN